MKPTPYNILKGIRYLKHYGFHEFLIRLKEKSEPEDISYMEWYEKHVVMQEELERQRKESESWKKRPLISIVVPTYNTPEKFLMQMIESVLNQSYTNWELCLADASEKDVVQNIVKRYQNSDERIKYQKLKANRGISENTNEALKLATGEYIGLLDHDDLLSIDALYEVAFAITVPESIEQSGVHWGTYNQKWNETSPFHLEETGCPDVIYTDEDKVTEDLTEHYAPHFKPDFNLDLLRSNNYITHFFVVKREIVDTIEGFRSTFDGAQDYDFIFRCIEQAHRVVHIPKVLYHWRMHQGSTAANQESKSYAFDEGKEVVQSHLDRMDVLGVTELTDNLGFYRVKYPVRDESMISILIPNKDEIDSLEKCIKSIARSTYNNYEVIIIENNSVDASTFAYYEKITTSVENEGEAIFYRQDGSVMPIKVVKWESNGVFNYSAINNYGASYAKGEYLVLLNNDIELLSENWIEELLGTCQRPEVAIAGARLYYPDDSIQHAGIVVGIGGHARGVASNMLTGMRRIQDGYLHKAGIQLDYSAVTAACLMIRKSVFDEVGGFTEYLTVAFNDVDLCLKARKAGYLIVYDPYVEAYHYESKSRGQEDSEEKVRRFQTEIEYMRTEWNDILRFGDPYYNPNFSRVKNNYSLNGMD